MSRRDSQQSGESSRRVRFSASDDESDVNYPGESSCHARVTASRSTSRVSYNTESSRWPSQPSGRIVNDILPSRSGFTNDELLSSSSSRQHDGYTQSNVAESTPGTEMSVLQERTAPLLDSRYLPDISHWESRILEYGEEPTSILDDVTRAEYEEIFERQKLPETAARERVMPKDMSNEDFKHYLRFLNEVHEPSRIRDGLYIANYETACHYLSGQGNKTKYYPKIGHVLSIISFHPKAAYLYDALKPADPKEFPEGTTLLLEVKDSIQVNFMELFPLIINFIVHAINQGGTPRGAGKGILIHCRKGMSRSIAAVMAYLTWAENKPIIDTWRNVVSLRPVAWPNSEFYTQLCMWRMWNCELTDGNGDPKGQYIEYVVEKGLSSAVVGVKADLTAHRGLKLPLKWPVGLAGR